jgi:outer membrane protein OmpA-like peptidoglycan-associated protein
MCWVYMEQAVVRSKAGFFLTATLALWLSACSSVPNAVNPVSWYRDLTGASKNDELGKGENEQNLNEGGNEPFPNLASVPAAPETALSTIDREKLVNSLIADRRNADYSAENLRAGQTAATAPPPPPAAANANSANTNSTPGAAGNATASPSTSANPVPAPTTLAVPSPAPPPPTATAAPAPPPSTSLAPTASAAASTAPAAAARTAATAPNPAPDATAAARRPPPRGSEPPPAESTLQTPQVSSVPQGETAPPPPPPPSIPPPNQVATTGAPAPAAKAPAPQPPAVSAAAPAAAPAAPAGPARRSASRIAEISFTAGSAYLPDTVRGTVADVAKLHQRQGGRIRVIGFGEARGKDAGMAGFTLALDRAQAVAVALTEAGVPAKDIAVEAAPVPARGGSDAPRAEIYIER